MIVLDTHAWIFLADDSRKLGRSGRQALARAERIGVAAISLWELTMLVEKKRLRQR